MPNKKPTIVLAKKPKPTLLFVRKPAIAPQPSFPNPAQPLNGRKLANVQLLRSLQA